jgi:hypothetical protein
VNVVTKSLKIAAFYVARKKEHVCSVHKFKNSIMRGLTGKFHPTAALNECRAPQRVQLIVAITWRHRLFNF